MKNTGIIILLITNIVLVNAQSKWKVSYYDSLNVDNFRSFKPFNETIDLENFDFRLANAAVFYMTNEIRKQKRRSVISYNQNLEVAAYNHSLDMATKNYFDHINSKNKRRKTPDDRARMAGIANPYIAENITEGFAIDYTANKEVYPRDKGNFSYTPNGELIKTLTYLKLAEKLLIAWMNSPHHKENIMSKNNIQLGCGVALYIDTGFNDMPMVKATQNFQQYENVRADYAFDRF